MTKPCASWATLDDLCEPWSGMYDTFDTGLMEQKLFEATEALYELSAQQFPGFCTETVTPCSARDWYDSFSYAPPAPRAIAGGFLWACSCYPYTSCGCRSFPSIPLPDFTQTIDEVVIDGVTLDPSAYVLRGNTLVRTDGQSFPCCTDAFTIEFTYGLEPPSLGVTAAAVLGSELYALCKPDSGVKCRLPRNVQSIARQGVSVIFNSLTRTSGPFRFGIAEIDIFLEAFNPKGNQTRSEILSPDVDFVELIT